VVLRYAEDRSIEDTALLLECSPATVRVQANRALAKLRDDPHLRLDFAAELPRSREATAS